MPLHRLCDNFKKRASWNRSEECTGPWAEQRLSVGCEDGAVDCKPMSLFARLVVGAEAHACAAVEIELESGLSRRAAYHRLCIKDELEAPCRARQRFMAQRFDNRLLRGLVDVRGADGGDV